MLITLVKDMINETNYFNERVYDFELERMNEALKVMHSAYSQQSKSTKFMHEMLGTSVLSFLKYEKENIAGLDELIDK
jgi:hypothetical protein